MIETTAVFVLCAWLLSDERMHRVLPHESASALLATAAVLALLFVTRRF